MSWMLLMTYMEVGRQRQRAVVNVTLSFQEQMADWHLRDCILTIEDVEPIGRSDMGGRKPRWPEEGREESLERSGSNATNGQIISRWAGCT